MLNELFGTKIEVEMEGILSFSKNLEKIEKITLNAINDKKILINLIENFFNMLNKGDLIRNEERDQNEITIKLVTILKCLEDIKKGQDH